MFNLTTGSEHLPTEKQKQLITALILDKKYDQAENELNALNDYHRITKKAILTETEIQDLQQAVTIGRFVNPTE